jgi:16S rRNA (uracil1498-N3)-methyltransferase
MRDKPARSARFYLDVDLRDGARLELPAEAAHHAVRVLRLRPGDEIVLFDGRGGEYPAQIEAIERSRVTLTVGAHRAIDRESPLEVTLVQGVSSGERMDVTIQKAVELGVRAIQPVLAERSVVKLDARRAETKREHWRRIAIAACEQCGRNRIPEVRAALALAEYCRAARDGAALKLLLSPQGGTRLREALAGRDTGIVLAVGPEAGFSADEDALLRAAGFVAVRLGPRVLRTETAASAALAALATLAGDF